MPLNEKQVKLIASKVKEEFALLEDYRKKQKEKRDREFIKREKKRLERKAYREKFEIVLKPQKIS
jgi:hypothetical protein